MYSNNLCICHHLHQCSCLISVTHIAGLMACPAGHGAAELHMQHMAPSHLSILGAVTDVVNAGYNGSTWLMYWLPVLLVPLMCTMVGMCLGWFGRKLYHCNHMDIPGDAPPAVVPEPEPPLGPLHIVISELELKQEELTKFTNDDLKQMCKLLGLKVGSNAVKSVMVDCISHQNIATAAQMRYMRVLAKKTNTPPQNHEFLSKLLASKYIEAQLAVSWG